MMERDKLRYRRADINDVESLVDYRIRFLKERAAQRGHVPRDAETQTLIENLRGYFSKAIPSNDFVALLAEENGKIVGTGALVVWKSPPKYGGLQSGRAGYILDLYTVPEARRMGICTHLLAELIKEAKTQGLKYLHLRATKDGMNIYKRAGFKEPEDQELQLTLE
jgi:ribosomal protein S18 acetylase RimI-like enzyme